MLDDSNPDDASRDPPSPDDEVLPDEDPPPPSLPTDVHAARARDGDPFSWATLEAKVTQMLKEAFAPGWRLRQYSVEDLIQVTLTDIYRDFGNFKPEAGSSFRAWARQIAKHNHLDMCRKEGREDKNARGLVHLDQSGSDSSDNLRDKIPDPDAHRPSMHARMHELSAAFRAALDDLRPEARMVVELRVFENLPFEEIARRVGRNKVETVKAIFHRAMEKLRGGLDGHAGVPA